MHCLCARNYITGTDVVTTYVTFLLGSPAFRLSKEWCQLCIAPVDEGNTTEQYLVFTGLNSALTQP